LADKNTARLKIEAVFTRSGRAPNCCTIEKRPQTGRPDTAAEI